MEVVWNSIAKYYSEFKVPCQYTSLKIGSFTEEDHPHKVYAKLKGKGIESRDLVFPLSKVWQDLGRGYHSFDAVT
eukprot:2410440-Pyramimonas_sp.AAC.1